MILSDDKITHLSHVLLKRLKEKGVVIAKADDAEIRKEIKRAVIKQLKMGEAIDSHIRKKLKSFSRNIVEGSSEWEVLYKKFSKEEGVKRGMDIG